MPVSEAIDLSEASKCMKCLEPGELAYIDTWLLANIAGGSLDPGELLEASKCFSCLTPGQLQEVKVYLLHQIANP